MMGFGQLYNNDKTDKMVIDTPRNYLANMEDHVKDDKTVDCKEVSGEDYLLNNICQI